MASRKHSEVGSVQRMAFPWAGRVQLVPELGRQKGADTRSWPRTTRQGHFHLSDPKNGGRRSAFLRESRPTHRRTRRRDHSTAPQGLQAVLVVAI